MAKGDSNDAQTAINTQGGMAQDNLNNIRNSVIQRGYGLSDLSNAANKQAGADYSSGMGGYNNFINNPGVQPNFASYGGYGNFASGGGQNYEAMPGYQNFSQTGGFSPQDIQDLRARAISPTRAVYANAQSNIDRQRSLQGGYSPNYTAATANLSRGLSNSISDANVNANASIAQAVQQGKLAGLGGMTNINQMQGQNKLASLGGMSNIENLISQIQLANRGQQLQGMAGQTGLYSAVPGQANMYGSQLGTNMSQQIDTQQLQNAIATMIINGQLGKATVPGNFQSAMGNIGSVLDLAGQGAGMASGLRA